VELIIKYMTINFKKLIEFNNKHPGNKLNCFYFILVNLLYSDEVDEDTIYNYITASVWKDYQQLYKVLEEIGLIKIIGRGYKDVSIRPLGLELIGEATVDDLFVLATKIRNLFPKGIKSGGYLVRNNEGDIADKLRKFFKKHKYSHEQVLKATQNYIKRKEVEGYSYMQKATYFIEKDGVSNLAAECDNLSEEVEFKDTMDRL